MTTTDGLTDMVRSFVAAAVRPAAEDLDATERFPAEIYARMGELGLFGITVPEADGGSGGSVADYVTVMEELAYGYASVADQCGLVELVASLLAGFGTPKQKKTYLPGLLAGTERCAYALTEPQAGSDLGALSTNARRDGDGWVLNGEKIFIHNAPVADFAMVLAVTDPARRKRGGMSMFLVDSSLPGVRQAYHEKKMGQRASQVGGFVFTDVRLPADALLGGEGEGFGAVMSVLEKGRLGIAALANGICRAALDTAREHALSRQQFGKPIAQFQAVAFSLADMATDHAAARQLIEHGADLLDRGVDAGSVCSMAKLFASEASIRTTSRAVQILGGSGFIRGVEAERLYRDARITTIYEGTSEVQRMIISRALLR
ncbi:acyl-CoA dehydrogenase family protein [Actinomadura sp. HBU206391]|uniref:acyl-CoA dehydrogenase family protein n=1 Tax=Actinomadura sp. HBU206391 TaxID=2731692 RepID=UPI00164FD64C|nr:acyl-CoA dehydrogenase family protein [Actinomadura sp. HBU206391]MBC6456518.1 acyl-CoA dehydrogenase family protein [Actinomadura sp. HBU206391]